MGHSHYLKPNRIYIVGSSKIVANTPPGINRVNVDEKKNNSSMLVYKFTSPMQSEYIKKKIMMFTINFPTIPYDGDLNRLQELDDIKVERSVMFAFETSDPNLYR